MHVHGDNLQQKETGEAKYADASSRKFLREIRKQYDVWKKANENLKGPTKTASPHDAEITRQRLELFATYKDFIDQQKYAEKFDSRSNLHSSVLEEFIYYLFRDLVGGFAERALIGKSHTFKDIFFMPPNYDAMLASPHARIEKKDHDFAIGVSVSAILKSAGQEKGEAHHFQIPAVAIECKTYLDKTMLEGASMAAEQLKFRNPNALYLVVSEWLKLTETEEHGPRVSFFAGLQKEPDLSRRGRTPVQHGSDAPHVGLGKRRRLRFATRIFALIANEPGAPNQARVLDRDMQVAD
jgi:Bpu10I restriction endonuclease